MRDNMAYIIWRWLKIVLAALCVAVSLLASCSFFHTMRIETLVIAGLAFSVTVYLIQGEDGREEV